MTLSELKLKLSDYSTYLLKDWYFLEREYWSYIGILAGVFLLVVFVSRNRLLKKISLVLFLGLVIFQLGIVLLSRSDFPSKPKYMREIPKTHLYVFGLGAISGVLGSLIIFQGLLRTKDIVKRKLSNPSSFIRPGFKDMRVVHEQLSKMSVTYKNETYHKKDKIFLGLTEKKVPIYIEQSFWRANHTQIVGTTGNGKGVLACSLVYQSVMQGESAVIFAPKDDEWAPYVLASAAARKGVPFFYIDLGGEVVQINPFQSSTKLQIEEILISAFCLAERGTDSDFYRLNDRAEAENFASFIHDNEGSLDKLVTQYIVENPDVEDQAPKFKADLLELIKLPVTHACKGLDLRNEIQQGAVIYVQGSMRNSAIIKLQKAILMQVIHACESRDRDSARHVAIFLDEFKYLISKPAMEALGAIRDKRAHLILAHQALNDLKDCPADMSPESVVSGVNENCAIKIAYKVNDPDTADWLSRMSGNILIDNEVREFELTPSLVEVNGTSRNLRLSERPLIDVNTLISLPPRCAVLFGDGLAEQIITAPIEVKKQVDNIEPHVFEVKTDNQTKNGPSSSLGEDLIDVD